MSREERGRRLRVARENLGLTKRRLAELVGADEDSIRNWEKLGREPREHLGKLREILGLDEALLPIERGDHGRPDYENMTNAQLVAAVREMMAAAAHVLAEVETRLLTETPTRGAVEDSFEPGERPGEISGDIKWPNQDDSRTTGRFRRDSAHRERYSR